jgi:hypothetical protein
MSSPEELSGVEETECCDSRWWNRRGLMRSRAHIFRNRCYKEWIPKFSGRLHEESEEAIVPMSGRTT